MRWVDRQTSDQLRIVDRWTHAVGMACVIGTWWMDPSSLRVGLALVGAAALLVSLTCWRERSRVLREEAEMEAQSRGE